MTPPPPVVMSIPLDNTQKILSDISCIPSHPRRYFPTPNMPQSRHAHLIQVAESVHGKHLCAAEKALKETPPDVSLFWLHSRMCDAVMATLEELKVLTKQENAEPVNPEGNPPTQQ